jgi:small conductance mechanosensitive channel
VPMPFNKRPDLNFDKMFETRSDAWEAVGLALEVNQKRVKRAQRQAAVIVPLIVAVLVLWGERHRILGEKFITPTQGHPVGHWQTSPWDTPIQVAAVIIFAVLGLALARQAGKAVGPALMKRMEPGVAGTVGFLVRLVTAFLTVLIALHVAGVNAQSLAIGASFTAVIFGLAAQQTLGNLIAGLVLLSARPFKVGERVRLQAGAVGGFVEGIVSSLGLLYTTLARGEDRIMIPNSVVLGAAVVPLREPDSVDVKVRLSAHMRLSELQDLLDARITTPIRGGQPSVLVEELDGDELVVRVQATPERAADGPKLADEIVAVLSAIASKRPVQVESD